jgi:hypothetical protein
MKYVGFKLLIFQHSKEARRRLIESLNSLVVCTEKLQSQLVGEKRDDGTYPCIVVTVWYEPPPSN